MRYTPAMLARLAYSYAAYELSERLVSEASTYGDEYGRGAFLAEEAATIVSEATALLEAAVVADRLRGASWPAVADALEMSAEAAEERFASSRAPVSRGAAVPAPPSRDRRPRIHRGAVRGRRARSRPRAARRLGRRAPPQQRT